MASWRKIILFGDSLTQYSFSPNGWGAAIADAFQRKADVIHRGFSGYNTKNAVNLLSHQFPKNCCKHGDVVLVFFGANDSVLKQYDQHIPLEEYSRNLATIIDHFSGLGIAEEEIFVLSPPPVDTEALVSHKISEGRGDDRDRLNPNTKLYAEAAEKVSKEKSCAYIDLWSAFMKERNWKIMLCDGLHFSDAGNQFVAKQIMNHLADLLAKWQVNEPDWKEFYVATG